LLLLGHQTLWVWVVWKGMVSLQHMGRHAHRGGNRHMNRKRPTEGRLLLLGVWMLLRRHLGRWQMGGMGHDRRRLDEGRLHDHRRPLMDHHTCVRRVWV